MPRSISESARLSNYDIAVVDEKLRRALIRPADHWQQSSELLARDKTQGSALRTGQHGPIRILFLPIRPAFSSTKIVPGIICSGIHSLRTFSSATISPPLEPNSSAMKPYCVYKVILTWTRCLSLNSESPRALAARYR